MSPTGRRVLVVSDRYPPRGGGLSRSAHRNVTSLCRHGVDVVVACPEPDLPLGERIRDDVEGVPVWRLGVGDALSGRDGAGEGTRLDEALQAWCDALVEIGARQRVDLLHAFYLVWSGYVATVAAGILDRPVVASARGNDVDREAFNPRSQPFLTWTLRRATAVTGVSREICARARILEPEARVRWVGNGVDTALYRPDGSLHPRVEALRGPDRPVLAFVGEGRRKKGLDTLLEAFGRLREKHDARLILIGALRPWADRRVERFRDKFPAAAADLAVDRADDEAELAAMLRAVDLVCLPSRHDGLPNAALEAMACATPVVGSAVGGIPDCVHHDETGWLMPPEDGRRWARGLEEVLAFGRARWERWGRAGRRLVEERFTPDAEWERNLSLYDELV